MHRSTKFCAALAATGLLAAPAAASAAGTVIAGPVKAKGYSISLTATDAGAGDTFNVFAVKTSGKSQQMHSWSLKNAKVSVKGNKATIKGNFGPFGKVNAKVVAGAKVKGIVPKGCTGTPGSARKGKLTGSTKLVLDSTYFRTFAPKGIKAQIVKGGKLDCAGGGGDGSQSKGLMLMSTAETPGGQLMVSILKDGDKVTQQVMRTDTATANADVLHIITALTGASGLTTAADLSTATAPGVSPFLAGTLSFAGESMGTMATGTVSGDFAAKFDSIGSQSLPAGNDGMLMQR